MSEWTKGKLKVKAEMPPSGLRWYVQIRQGKNTIATIIHYDFDTAKAIAAKLVHCVNSHDALVEACKEYVEWFEKMKRYQDQRLGHGLKEACQNWEETSDIEPFDCTKMKAALAEVKE